MTHPAPNAPIWLCTFIFGWQPCDYNLYIFCGSPGSLCLAPPYFCSHSLPTQTLLSDNITLGILFGRPLRTLSEVEHHPIAMRSSVTLFILLVLVVSTTWAHHWVWNVDFDYCYDEVKNLNTANLSDNRRQYFLFDPRTGQRIHPDRVLLTLEGCEEICHDGYGLWPAQDTLLRLILWLLPAVVLVAHFHFAPLPATNICQVILHLLGDPVDSMWSMLTRQEANRRFFRRATTRGLQNGQPVATVWSAYDELGWKDPSAFFFKSLRERAPTVPTNATPSPPTLGGNLSGQGGWNFIRRATTWANREPEVAQDTQFRFPPDNTEMYYIELAAQRLTSNRSESQLTTWIAIGGLIGGLFAAFIRTWTLRLNNQTSHTIAAVSLLFIFIPLVKISGNIGAFTSSTAVVDIIQELRRNLSEYDKRLGLERPALFPPLVFGDDPLWNGKIATTNHGRRMSSGLNNLPAGNAEVEILIDRGIDASEEVSNVENWPSMAPWLGMNASWRPSKRITTKDEYVSTDRSPTTLFILSALFVVAGSYAPALCLSYFTPLVGFGCRSLSWTVVVGTWTLSWATDVILKYSIKFAKKLWTWTIVKDLVCSFWIVLVIFVVQVGFFNSCWCRSGALTHSKKSYVDLNPLTDADWHSGWWLWVMTPVAALGIIVVLIMVVGIDGDNARTLLNRTSTAREQNIINLNNRRRGLLWEPIDTQPTQLPNMTQLMGESSHVAGSGSARPSQEQFLNSQPIFRSPFNNNNNNNASSSTADIPLIRVSSDATNSTSGTSIELNRLDPLNRSSSEERANHPPLEQEHFLGRPPRWQTDARILA